MAFNVADRVKERVTTSGIGDVSLEGNAASGFQSFGSALNNGDYTFYVLEEYDLWEVGYGRYLNDTLQRTTIFTSSASGDPINLGGSGTVSITYPAERSVYLNEDLNAVVGSGLIFTNSSQKLNTTSSNLYWDSNKLGYDSDIVYVSGIAMYSLILANSGAKGAGTANEVAFWSDTNTITGDSNLYWDNTNDRLGVGTASPATRVDIAGTGTLDYIQFDSSITDTDQPTAGMSWNNNAGTIDIGINGGHTMHIGQDVYYRVQNQTGSTIYQGQAVYYDSVIGGGDRMLIDKFVADASIQEARFLGLATEEISHGSTGFIQHFGHIKHVDLRTSNTNVNPDGETWSEGDILFAHPTTAGGLTKNEPKDAIYVAVVLRSGNNGQLFVRPKDHGHISDLHDIDITGLNDNNFLVWNSGADYWQPSTNLTFADNTLHLSGSGYFVQGIATSGNVYAPSIGAGVDNSVVVLNSAGYLKTDEIDSRVWGSTLADDSDISIINLDIDSVSGIAVQNTLDIDYVSGVANYASGQAIQNQESIQYMSGVLSPTYKNIDTDTSLQQTDSTVFVDSTASPINVYIPSAVGIGGKDIKIKRVAGENIVEIVASGSQTIDGSNSYVMNHLYESTTITSNNSNWFIT